jgi:predicted nucleic acid-binding protein
VPLVLPDTSVWMRRDQPVVGPVLAEAIEADEVVVVLPIVLELLRAARDVRHLRLRARRYGALREVQMTAAVGRRARAVQEALAERGYHRGPSPTDLAAAAAAESAGAELWHCDRHFELIGEVTGQPMRRLGR